MGVMQGGTFYNGYVIGSDDSFTYTASTNQITTGVDDQVFYLEDPETNERIMAKSFTWTAVGSDVSFLMESKASGGIIVANGETKGYENLFYLLKFTVSGTAGKVFEFECIA